MRNPVVEEDLAYITSASLPWSDLEGRTLVISGANGFLASYIVETLMYLNENKFTEQVQVIGVVRDAQRAWTKFADHVRRGCLHFLVQDVCMPVCIKEQVDYVIHAASQASPKYYGIDPVGTLSANVLGTHNMLHLAHEHHVKGFLFFSSGEVYGKVDPDHIPTREDWYGYMDPMDMRSCYGESKRLGETMCVSWMHQYRVPARIVRPFHIYGPGMRLDDNRVFADFVADILDNHDIIVKSDGSALRTFCYLADAILGFFTVLLCGQNGQAYNIGDDREEISILGLAQRLADLFPEKNLRVAQRDRVETPGYIASCILRSCPDISKARALGWEPKTSIEAGFSRTVRSFA